MKTTEQHTHRATHIHPTVGRVVLFHLGDPHHGPYPGWGVTPDGSNTYAATVAYVHNAHMVNLTASDANGIQMGFTSVPLVQGEDERPAGHWCEWMPYQKIQAAKTEQLESALATADRVHRAHDSGEHRIGTLQDAAHATGKYEEVSATEREAQSRRAEETRANDVVRHPVIGAAQALDNDGNPLT